MCPLLACVFLTVVCLVISYCIAVFCYLLKSSSIYPQILVMSCLKHRQYTLDLKQRVIHQHFALKHKSKEIARDLDIPLQVVQRVITTHVCTGELGGNQRGRKWHSMTSEQVEVKQSPLACRCNLSHV